jgi:hypothetical protein
LAQNRLGDLDAAVLNQREAMELASRPGAVAGDLAGARERLTRFERALAERN